jgi:hypothetical protein
LIQQQNLAFSASPIYTCLGAPLHSYSLPTKEIDIKNQELALRREAPPR